MSQESLNEPGGAGNNRAVVKPVSKQAKEEEGFKKLSKFLTPKSGYTPAKIELIRQTVAKNTTNLELAYFLSIAKGINLNPLVKEIWCYKDKKGNLIIFAGRDGFRRVCLRDKGFISINSMEVREGDTFSISTQMGETLVHHQFTPTDDLRHKKKILGAYAILRSKRAGEVTEIVEWADMGRYGKGGNPKYQIVWDTHPEEMIKKVAEVHAMKKFTNISSVYCDAEFEIIDDIVQTGPSEPALIEAGKERKAAIREKNNISK